MNNVEKASDYEIEVTKVPVTPEPTKVKYGYDFLIAQRDRITADAANYAQARQADLDEVNGYIAEADSLGVTSKQAAQASPAEPAVPLEP